MWLKIAPIYKNLIHLIIIFFHFLTLNNHSSETKKRYLSPVLTKSLPGNCSIR